MTDADLIARVRAWDQQPEALTESENSDLLDVAAQLAERLAETRAKVEQMREERDEARRVARQFGDTVAPMGIAGPFGTIGKWPAPAHADTERT